MQNKAVSLSNRVHPATRNMLECYPLRDLKYYAEQLGVEVGKTKEQTIDNLMASGKATICGTLGD